MSIYDYLCIDENINIKSSGFNREINYVGY